MYVCYYHKKLTSSITLPLFFQKEPRNGEHIYKAVAFLRTIS